MRSEVENGNFYQLLQGAPMLCLLEYDPQYLVRYIYHKPSSSIIDYLCSDFSIAVFGLLTSMTR